MLEHRRILVEPNRLKKLDSSRLNFLLNNDEIHYLRRVLRLNIGNLIDVVDGVGHLWEGVLQEDNTVLMNTVINTTFQNQPNIRPLICLAVVVPKRGFNEILRMSCELGVDILQPLCSERSNSSSSLSRPSRWESIIRESVEQSERLWKPELLSQIKFSDWIVEVSKQEVAIAFSQTRIQGLIDFQSWLENIDKTIDKVWIVIGPEGGWSQSESSLAKTLTIDSVQFSEHILTTSTAAVAATQIMVAWRRFDGITPI